MTQKLIKTVNALFLIASHSLAIGLTMFIPSEPEEETVEIKETEEFIEPETETETEIKSPKRQPNEALLGELELRNIWQSLDISYITIETEYLGVYFLTAYSDEETNSRATA